MAKDDSGMFGDDLYTGLNGGPFRNEQLVESNRKRKEFEAKQAARPKGVRGLVEDLQGLLNTAKLENDSFGSYMKTMVAKEREIKPEDMIAEFRAREMNLALIERIQKCLDKYRMPTPR